MSAITLEDTASCCYLLPLPNGTGNQELPSAVAKAQSDKPPVLGCFHVVIAISV
jgi:hypothetical protein